MENELKLYKNQVDEYRRDIKLINNDQEINNLLRYLDNIELNNIIYYNYLPIIEIYNQIN